MQDQGEDEDEYKELVEIYGEGYIAQQGVALRAIEIMADLVTIQ